MSDAFSFKDYFAARGSRFTDKDAKIIGPALENLNAEGKGTAADIVDAARPDDAPLHRYFEWDDGVAAERYRETQARHMARRERLEPRPHGCARVGRHVRTRPHGILEPGHGRSPGRRGQGERLGHLINSRSPLDTLLDCLLQSGTWKTTTPQTTTRILENRPPKNS
jgi:hypothetical protein